MSGHLAVRSASAADMPAAAGHALPAFPTIDEIIAAYAGNPGPHA